jgi:hypothetical protein
MVWISIASIREELSDLIRRERLDVYLETVP